MEKILDSLRAGCVPIYWGANNVADLIPVDYFINPRQFDEMPVLHAYLEPIDERHYAQYQEAILAFLDSEADQCFSTERFVKIVSDRICGWSGQGVVPVAGRKNKSQAHSNACTQTSQ
jgi:alpha(1,3/1,4) fucosyltransferase